MPLRRDHRHIAQYGGHSSGPPVAAFDPTTVTGLVSWYDFSDAATLFTDTGRTTPVASDTDLIKGVTDKSAAATHLSEATNPPQYKVNIQNSKSVGRFDGTNDLLTSTVTADASQTLFFVTKKRSAGDGSSRTVFGWHANAEVFASNVTTQWQYFATQGAAVANLGGTITDWSIIELVYASAAAVTPYVNGTVGSVFDPSNEISTSTTFQLGGVFSGTAACDIDVAEVLRYDTALGDTDRDAVESGLGTKWNITVA